MDRQTELSLLDELLGLKGRKSAYLDEAVVQSPIARYMSPERFEQEMAHLFRGLPVMAAHGSELENPGDFLRREISGLPAIICRDRQGAVHAYLNVCRHRGARLVEDGEGCRHSFTCPYHGWTWANTGELRSVPHEAQGFPDLDKGKYGLRRLPTKEMHGWIFVLPNPDGVSNFDLPSEIAADFDWIGMADHCIVQESTIDAPANWKQLAEGGIEAYHFRVAHKNTIAPYFQDNLSSYQGFGPHIRSVLPRATLDDLRDKPRDSWSIRDDANLLYTILPTTQILVQQDHFIWVMMDPRSEGETRLRLATMVPKDSSMPSEYWAQNHAITMRTLKEDFDIGVGVQAGFASRANTDHTFGRYEGALDLFNRTVESYLPG